MAKKAKVRSTTPFVAGIGASAGGLEAIEEFFAHMPSDSGLSFVVIQSVPSHHEKGIGTSIKKNTKMKAVQIKEGMKIKPDCIYFSPPHKDVTVMDDVLYLMEPVEIRGARMPINFFLRSLAESYRERSICIILSGTDSDGASGLKAIKEAGGLVVVQDLKQADFSGIPESAAGTKLVDYVLPVKEMPGILSQYVRYFQATHEKGQISDQEEFDNYLQKIMLFMPSKTGHSLSEIHWREYCKELAVL